ncbi:MAG: four helix bundle protein [Patescibacteria group bacterium]
MLKTFKDLMVWQKSHLLVLDIYKITELFPKTEMFCLVSQMRRAAVSVAANIVEGFRRRSLRDSINFYNMADASLEELKYHLLLSKDLKYVSDETYSRVLTLAEETSKLLMRWIQSQQKNLSA